MSNLNSLATVTFEDFIKPIPALKGMKDVNQLRTIKLVGVLYGFIIMGISFGVGLLDGVIESSMLLTSATSGPLLGVFIMALLIPCANWKVSYLIITNLLLTTYTYTYYSLRERQIKFIILNVNDNYSGNYFIIKRHLFCYHVVYILRHILLFVHTSRRGNQIIKTTVSPFPTKLLP